MRIRHMPRGAIPVLAAALLAPAAQAADKPLPMPAHDATILYAVHARNHDQQMRVYFGHAGDLLRVDGPNGEGDTVLDRATGTLTIIINGARAYMVIPSKGPIADPFLLDPSEGYQRAGTTQQIAGLTCQDWQVTSPKGQAQACVTGDGLLLAATGVDGSGESGAVRALSVSTAPLAPGTFTPPPGYQRIAHPAARP